MNTNPDNNLNYETLLVAAKEILLHKNLKPTLFPRTIKDIDVDIFKKNLGTKILVLSLSYKIGLILEVSIDDVPGDFGEINLKSFIARGLSKESLNLISHVLEELITILEYDNDWAAVELNKFTKKS